MIVEKDSLRLFVHREELVTRDARLRENRSKRRTLETPVIGKR